MSSPRDASPAQATDPEPPAKGPNLTLYYILLALALVGAIGFAIAIVWPFYIQR